jgi:anti-anti-sigma factor
MELPQQLNLSQAKSFLRELQPLLEADRPRLVLECSQIHDMDSAGVEMLLRCMQEAMKRDGDLSFLPILSSH